MFSRLPLSTWSQIPFKDDYTPLYQSAVNGVRLLERGSVVGWNWWLLGGYPTSTDIAQSFGALAFIPMRSSASASGITCCTPWCFSRFRLFVWWDIRQDDREASAAGRRVRLSLHGRLLRHLGNSGDTNSLLGVFCAGLAIVGSRAARLGRRWGGPLLLLGLTLGLYSHVAFSVYAGIYLLLEAAYYRDVRAVLRLAAASALRNHRVAARALGVAALSGVSSASTTPSTTPARRSTGRSLVRTIYYNVEILALPHRWFNDYRSLANVWLPALVVMALAPGRSRAGFYAVRRRTHAGVAAAEHVGDRRAVRSHPAHDAAARGSGACRVRAAVQRHAEAGDGARRAYRTVRRDVVRASAPRAGRCAASIRR